MRKRILSILLALCMILVGGGMPTTAFADDDSDTNTGKAIHLGTSGISGYDSTTGYDYIYFGNWTAPDEYTTSGPIKWRVLDDKTNTGETGLFLLSDVLLGTDMWGKVSFNETNLGSKAWQGSSAQAWCKDFAGEAGAGNDVPDAFTAGELGAVLATSKSDGEFKIGNKMLFSASEDILKGD